METGTADAVSQLRRSATKDQQLVQSAGRLSGPVDDLGDSRAGRTCSGDAAMAGVLGTDAAETSGAETAVIAHCVGTACRRIKIWFTLHVALLLWLTMAT